MEDVLDELRRARRIERITDAMPGVAYLRLLEASGRCPPEDIGGPWGYAELLEAIAGPHTSATLNTRN